jgi:hypothetical protein
MFGKFMSMWGHKEPNLENKDKVTLEAKQPDLENNEPNLESKDEVTWADNIFETSNNPASLSYGYEKLVEIPTLKEGMGSRGVLKKLATLEFIKEATWNLENAKKVESFAKENGIAINFKEAIQKVFIEMVNNGRIDSILKMERYAKDKNINLEVPSQEHFQIAFNKQLISHANDWLNGAGERAKKIEEYALQNGIKIELNGPLQQAFNGLLSTGAVEQAIKAEEYAKEKNVELSFDSIQEGYDKLLETGYLSGANRLENYAKEKGIELRKPSLEVLQKIYEKVLIEGDFEWITISKNVELYASKHEVKLLKVQQEILQQGFENCLSRVSYKWQTSAQEALDYAKNNNIELNIDEVFQRAYKQVQSSEDSRKILDFESFASKQGIKLSEIDKEVVQNNLQTHFEYYLASGDVKRAEEIKSFAINKGVELRSASSTTELFEECYIALLHNYKEGHAEGKRKRLLEQAKDKGFKLDYNKYIKINYLDYLNVPINERLNKVQDVSVGRATVKATFFGHVKKTGTDATDRPKNNFCQGKFILAENKSTKKIQFIFDSTMGEHGDIAVKYDVDAIGGGRIEINNDNKEVIIERESQKFGYEPRLITVKVVSDCFPDYKCSVS